MTAPVRPLLLALAALLGSPLAACSSTCQQIQQQLCECQFQTQNERNSCEDAASAQAKLDEPTAAELTACEAISTTCEEYISAHPPKNGACPAVQTVEGRRACGIAAQQ